jgi:predicted mannosyl-3-phosphoglycerate phosphatase (HAD superfamily)
MTPTLHTRAINARDMAEEVRDRILSAIGEGLPPHPMPAEVMQLALIVQGLSNTVAELVTATERPVRRVRKP